VIVTLRSYGSIVSPLRHIHRTLIVASVRSATRHVANTKRFALLMLSRYVPHAHSAHSAHSAELKQDNSECAVWLCTWADLVDCSAPVLALLRDAQSVRLPFAFALLLCCCVAVLLCCCVAVLLCCCVAVLLMGVKVVFVPASHIKLALRALCREKRVQYSQMLGSIVALMREHKIPIALFNPPKQ
jgi:hypothetical protein